MFFLRHKTKLVDTGFFRDFVDSYSHIFPGVDDGIRTIGGVGVLRIARSEECEADG